MSLETKAIAAVRQKLSSSTVNDLYNEWRNSYTLPAFICGDKGVMYQHDLRRDILAFSILHYVYMLGGYCFGGFVREFHSGFGWRDLDIKLDGSVIHTFHTRLALILSNHLGLDVFYFGIDRITKNNSLYNVSVESFVLRWICEDEEIIIPVDIVEKMAIPKSIPVTVGSCLRIDRDHVSFLKEYENGTIGPRTWNIKDILKLLTSGKDVCSIMWPLDFQASHDGDFSTYDRYRVYYYSKKEYLQKRYIIISDDLKSE